VQIVVALAVIMTAGAVIRVAESPATLGSLGEWVSGLGAILAAMVALWIADDQRRQANAQFAEERRHATEMANDERRYQEALARAERDRTLQEQRSADYKAGVWVLRSIGSGMRLMIDFTDQIIADPSKRTQFANIILSSRATIASSRIFESLGPASFNDSDINVTASQLSSLWSIHLFALEWVGQSTTISDDLVINIIDYTLFKSAMNSMVKKVVALAPEGVVAHESIGENGWSTWIYPEI